VFGDELDVRGARNLNSLTGGPNLKGLAGAFPAFGHRD
jgi:hypothetical protein